MSDLTTTLNLNITDIADGIRIVDHAADEGGFRGWDNIRQVLALRDRVNQFVTTAGDLDKTDPTAVANLNIADIADIVKIIDYAADQASFHGWTNIRQIITVRDRLELFVAAAQEADRQKSVPAAEAA